MKTTGSGFRGSLSPLFIMLSLAATAFVFQGLGCFRPPVQLVEPVVEPLPVFIPVVETLGINDQGFEEFLWLKDSSVMVRIPAGTFTMGSATTEREERPVRQVYLEDFLINKHPITNRQYKRFCDETGREYPWNPYFDCMPDYFEKYPDHPVVNINWYDAKDYCDWAGKRLPTEAEWEKAARGTDGRTYPWGNKAPDGSQCNLADRNLHITTANRRICDGYRFTSPVGNYPAGTSPYGIKDMAGNVLEWCVDWYDERYYSWAPDSNPAGASSGHYRVQRGGSWFDAAGQVRSAYRDYFTPTSRLTNFGFRSAVFTDVLEEAYQASR